MLITDYLLGEPTLADELRVEERFVTDGKFLKELISWFKLRYRAGVAGG